MSEPCPPGCSCNRHSTLPRVKCPTGCTCARHTRTVRKKCLEGCTCKRHTPNAERGRRISEALTGKPLAATHPRRATCAPGCDCWKHSHRNAGQFQPGGAGFARPHTEETKAKLAAYTGDQASAYKHGWAKTPTYRSWSSMHSRCIHPGNASWSRYGGRGIAVCERWSDFLKFLEDMGPRPDDMTLDRINRDGNYEPSNCRWATKAQQENNKHNPWTEPEKRARITAGRRKSAARRQRME